MGPLTLFSGHTGEDNSHQVLHATSSLDELELHHLDPVYLYSHNVFLFELIDGGDALIIDQDANVKVGATRAAAAVCGIVVD